MEQEIILQRIQEMDAVNLENLLKQHVSSCKNKDCLTCRKIRIRIFVKKYPLLGRVLFPSSFNENFDSLKLLREKYDYDKVYNLQLLGVGAKSTYFYAREVCHSLKVSHDRMQEVLRDPQQIKTNAEFTECVLLRPDYWSASSHILFPDNTRKRAVQLLYIGYQMDTRHGFSIDVWRTWVMPYALEETLDLP